MIGGFLGAGKTTSVLKLAEWLTARGKRVGLISNDQGSGLVDTAMFASHRFPVQEISGGCFCCRFDSLVSAAARLTASTRPDVFIAEPVGSCTDLVATVAYPLRQIYGESYLIAPFSVVLDPVRAARMLGLERGAQFSDKVSYIYRKQMEEADLLVINKCDHYEPGKRAVLRDALTGAYPHARILEVSARQGDGLDAWFGQVITGQQQPHASMEVDYDVYAQGEALLGWFNATLELTAAHPFDANALLKKLARDIQSQLNMRSAEVAHLKMTLDGRGAFKELAVVNLVRNDFVPELSQELPEPVSAAELTVNLRAECEPGVLREIVTRAVEGVCAGAKLSAQWRAVEAFKPGKPAPTHRLP